MEAALILIKGDQKYDLGLNFHCLSKCTERPFFNKPPSFVNKTHDGSSAQLSIKIKVGCQFEVTNELGRFSSLVLTSQIMIF